MDVSPNNDVDANKNEASAVHCHRQEVFATVSLYVRLIVLETSTYGYGAIINTYSVN